MEQFFQRVWPSPSECSRNSCPLHFCYRWRSTQFARSDPLQSGEITTSDCYVSFGRQRGLRKWSCTAYSSVENAQNAFRFQMREPSIHGPTPRWRTDEESAAPKSRAAASSRPASARAVHISRGAAELSNGTGGVSESHVRRVTSI